MSKNILQIPKKEQIIRLKKILNVIFFENTNRPDKRIILSRLVNLTGESKNTLNTIISVLNKFELVYGLSKGNLVNQKTLDNFICRNYTHKIVDNQIVYEGYLSITTTDFILDNYPLVAKFNLREYKNILGVDLKASDNSKDIFIDYMVAILFLELNSKLNALNFITPMFENNINFLKWHLKIRERITDFWIVESIAYVRTIEIIK